MNQAKRKKWEQHVADYERSGQSQNAWCRDNDVKVNRLRYWIKKFENEKVAVKRDIDTSTNWVKADTFRSKQEKVHDEALVITIGKASIKVNPDFDADFLKKVIGTLSSIC